MINIVGDLSISKVQSTMPDNKVYSNKRRSHIHFIHQFFANDMRYSGSRVVLFIKGGAKLAYDTEGFIIHVYENPKLKVNEVTSWKITPCSLIRVIKKEMTNYSLDCKLKMNHVIYESPSRPLEEFIFDCFKEEGVELPQSFRNELFQYKN